MIVRATIWLALALFLAGEIGRARRFGTRSSSRWPWVAFTAGALVCAIHVLAAYHWHHGWSQASVVAETARQTAAIYGWNWGGGVYVNYAFVGVWLADAIWWRIDPAFDRRPRWAGWTLRAFYFIVIVNAAVIFARGAGRAAGVALVAALAWVWARERTEAREGTW